MRNLILLALIIVGPACLAQSSAGAAFKWSSEDASHDFGKIKKGKPVTHSFNFVNTGDTPLMITDVKTSCGCTTPGWTKDPVPPGGEGYIKATYNAAKAGAFNKSVSVTANVEGGVVHLKIRGEVLTVEAFKVNQSKPSEEEKKAGAPKDSENKKSGN